MKPSSLERSRQTFDRQAWSYDTASYGRHARTLYPIVLEQLEQIPHRSILDVGCGTGALLQAVRTKFPEARCAGLDLSEHMLTVAREKLDPSVLLKQGEAARLPFDSSSFEAVICNDSFHHYPQPKQALREMARVLRPGGVLLLSDCTAPAGIRKILNWFLPLSREGDVHLYNAEELCALLSPQFSGVECRRVSSTSLLAWGIRAGAQPSAL